MRMVDNSDSHLAMKKTKPIIGTDEVSTGCDSAGSSISSQCVLDGAESKEEVAPVACVWVNDPAQETKAKVQPYVDKVLAIFEKCKKGTHKLKGTFTF